MSVAASFEHFELDVLQNRLGAAGRRDGGDGLKRVQQLFSVAGDFHRREILSIAGIPHVRMTF